MKTNSSKDPLHIRLRRLFGTGFLVIGPLFLTIWIVVKLFLFADGFLGKPIQYFLGNILKISYFQTQTVHGIGLILLVALILGIGWFARQYLGDRLVKLINTVFERIPFINKVYVAILQISQALLGGNRDTFKHAVMIEYPRAGIYSIGFVTQDTRGPAQEVITEDVLSIFIPTTPNPTSGFLLFVPKDQVMYLDIPVEEALKLIISAGTVTPSGFQGGKRKEPEKSINSLDEN